MSHIRSQLNDGVLHIVIDRPERKNALTTPMYADLADALDRAQADPQVKVVLLSGAGGVFTAGNDLDDFVANPPRDMDAPVFRFMLTIAACSKPIVAAVEGLAIGVGTTLLLHCDLVYVAEDARFSLPFVGLGLVPEAGSSLLLSRVAGHQRAAEKLLLGDVFTATEAQTLGFINALLPAPQLLAHAQAQATRLARLPAGSVRGTKSLMKEAATQEAQHQIRQEAAVFIERVTGPAMQEAIAAFKGKRKPDFTGRD